MVGVWVLVLHEPALNKKLQVLIGWPVAIQMTEVKGQPALQLYACHRFPRKDKPIAHDIDAEQTHYGASVSVR